MRVRSLLQPIDQPGAIGAGGIATISRHAPK